MVPLKCPIGSDAYNFVRENYYRKYSSVDVTQLEYYDEGIEREFENYFNLYLALPVFKANENIHEILTNYSKRDELSDVEGEFVKGDSLDPHIHWIMRSLTQFYLTKAFEAMKIDTFDDNIKENSLGKGTPGRIAKMWCGNDPEDTTELGSGRWNKEPFISCFPNDGETGIVTKEVDVMSCCSHHFLPFSTFDGGKAIVSYKPNDYLIGISKLQRFVNWASRRFWLQEDLTKYIGNTIKRIAKTEDVYVKLEGLVHGCEKFRGANTKNGSLTTEFKSGIFKNN